MVCLIFGIFALEGFVRRPVGGASPLGWTKDGWFLWSTHLVLCSLVQYFHSRAKSRFF